MIKKVKKSKATLEIVNRNVERLSHTVERLAVSVAKGFEETATKADILRLDKKINGVEKRLEQKIDGVEQRLELKIDGVRSIIVVDHGHRIEKLEKGLSQVNGSLGMVK